MGYRALDVRVRVWYLGFSVCSFSVVGLRVLHKYNDEVHMEQEAGG